MEPKQTISIEVSIDEGLKEELDEINKQNKEIQDLIAHARKQILNGEYKYEVEKIVVMNNIARETDEETGKKVYSNESRRKEQFITLMETGHPLATLKHQLEEDREKLELKESERDFLRRRIQIFDITTRR